jgi:hypothetical protein
MAALGRAVAFLAPQVTVYRYPFTLLTKAVHAWSVPGFVLGSTEVQDAAGRHGRRFSN